MVEFLTEEYLLVTLSVVFSFMISCVLILNEKRKNKEELLIIKKLYDFDYRKIKHKLDLAESENKHLKSKMNDYVMCQDQYESFLSEWKPKADSCYPSRISNINHSKFKYYLKRIWDWDHSDINPWSKQNNYGGYMNRFQAQYCDSCHSNDVVKNGRCLLCHEIKELK